MAFRDAAVITDGTRERMMTDELAGKTMRKIGWRILPFAMLLYFVSFIDRVNIGFAALTMNKDIGLSSAAFGLGAGIFFAGYFLFEVPSNLILHKVGARVWIARVMISWGIASGATAFVQGPTGFYVLRFILGVAEAGFFPGMILYLSYWFPASHRAAATSVFMAAAPLSTALGSPLSGALMQAHAFGLKGWQLMFLTEAVPAVLLGIAVLFVLTSRPENAKWLADDERGWLVDTLKRERQGQGTRHRTILQGMMDGRVLVLSLIYFGTSAGLYVLGIWSPQIIAGFGLTPMQIGWVNGVPGIAAVAAMILWSRHSDRTGERTWHVVLACLLAAVGLFYCGLAGSLVGVVLALVLVNIGVSASKPPLWAMPGKFLDGAAAAAGIATINALGNLGGFVGPAMLGLLKGWTGSFSGGLYFTAALLLLSALLTLLLARSARAKPLAAAAGES
jgi:MFS transporter, ACS family, tartrate transporter